LSFIPTPAIARPRDAIAYRSDIDGLRAIAVLAVCIVGYREHRTARLVDAPRASPSSVRQRR
jgi:hypothetical protein